MKRRIIQSILRQPQVSDALQVLTDIVLIGHTGVMKVFVKLCGKEVASMEDTNGTLPVYFAAQEGETLLMDN